MKVFAIDYYNSKEAIAFRHIKKNLKKNNFEISSTGEGMDKVVEHMTKSGFYTFEIIHEKPGYFKVIPTINENKILKKEKSRSSFSYCNIILIIIIVSFIVSTFMIYFFIISIVEKQIDYVEKSQKCHHMPCFICTLFNKNLKQWKELCNKCCLTFYFFIFFGIDSNASLSAFQYHTGVGGPPPKAIQL
jgi:hypothetical protein